MTFDRLKEILTQENISPYKYDILDLGGVKGYDGYVITVNAKGYNLYYEERGQKDLIAQFSSEHDVCIAFLQELVRNNRDFLAKYIQ